MADKLLAVIAQYVRSYLTLWQQDVRWPESVLQALTDLRLDMSDILFVLKEGDVIECEKETNHGANVIMEGRTCDGVRVRVEFWSDANVPAIGIRKIDLI